MNDTLPIENFQLRVTRKYDTLLSLLEHPLKPELLRYLLTYRVVLMQEQCVIKRMSEHVRDYYSCRCLQSHKP